MLYVNDKFSWVDYWILSGRHYSRYSMTSFIETLKIFFLNCVCLSCSPVWMFVLLHPNLLSCLFNLNRFSNCSTLMHHVSNCLPTKFLSRLIPILLCYNCFPGTYYFKINKFDLILISVNLGWNIWTWSCFQILSLLLNIKFHLGLIRILNLVNRLSDVPVESFFKSRPVRNHRGHPRMF